MIEDYKYLAVIDACCTGKELWFASWYSNGIFKLNLNTKEIEFVDFFQGNEFINEKVLQTYMYQDKIYFFNMFDNICKNYGIVSLNIHDLTQEGYWRFQREEEVYHYVVQNGDKFIAIPQKCIEPLIIFDLKKKESYKVENWVASKSIQGKAFGRMIKIGSGCYSICANTNQLMRLDISSMRAEVQEAFSFKFRWNQLIEDEERNAFFATGYQEKHFLEWRDGVVTFIDLPAGVEAVERGCVCGGKLYLFPVNDLCDIVVYHIESKKITTIPFPKEIRLIPSRRNCPVFGRVKTFGNMIVALPWRIDSFLFIDAQTDIVTTVSSKIDIELARKCYIQGIDMVEPIVETEAVSLKDLLAKMMV